MQKVILDQNIAFSFQFVFTCFLRGEEFLCNFVLSQLCSTVGVHSSDESAAGRAVSMEHCVF